MKKSQMPVSSLERGVVLIADLVPADYNPRTISPDAMKGLQSSLARFGIVQEVVVNRRSGRIVGGHQRVAALKVVGVSEAPCVWVDLSDAEEKALNVALNNPHISGDFTSGLNAILDEVKGLDPVMFEDLRLDLLLTPVDAAPLVDGDPDDAPAVDDEATPDSVVGGVYELGPHRLVCGDSTTAEAWALLMGSERAQMVWTDPPYGVSVVGASKDPRAATYRSGNTIDNDSLSPEALRTLLDDSLGITVAHAVPGAAVYVAAPAGKLQQVFGAALEMIDVWRHTLIWVKQNFVFGRSDYHYRHELIFYGWVPGSAHFFVDDRKQDSVLEIDRPNNPSRKSKDAHPTMKPVELVARCIRNSSKPGWIVVDPFGGSGTTLIASAKEGRVARLIELAPRYCDVIRRRWTTFARENKVDPGEGALE